MERRFLNYFFCSFSKVFNYSRLSSSYHFFISSSYFLSVFVLSLKTRLQTKYIFNSHYHVLNTSQHQFQGLKKKICINVIPMIFLLHFNQTICHNISSYRYVKFLDVVFFRIFLCDLVVGGFKVDVGGQFSLSEDKNSIQCG